MSEKRIKFRELAEKRVNNAMKNIQLIGNLSNTRAYEYDDEEEFSEEMAEMYDELENEYQ